MADSKLARCKKTPSFRIEWKILFHHRNQIESKNMSSIATKKNTLGSMVIFILTVLTMLASHPTAAQNSGNTKIGSWVTAEMLGAMRWAKSETPTRSERLEYAIAERICRERLYKQIDAGSIAKASALIITERVRKDGIYRGESLTLERSAELRRAIISGKIFADLRD
jgi:hypothetical protein